MTERLYPLTRIREGDYVLLSNDRQTLWRITRYEETGLGESQDANGRWRKITGWYWQTAKYKRRIDTLDNPYANDWDTFLDWENWEHWSSMCKTRRDAVEDALR